jgi:hypothetical protein
MSTATGTSSVPTSSRPGTPGDIPTKDYPNISVNGHTNEPKINGHSLDINPGSGISDGPIRPEMLGMEKEYR